MESKFKCPLCSHEHPEGTEYCEIMLSEIPKAPADENGLSGASMGEHGAADGHAATRLTPEMLLEWAISASDGDGEAKSLIEGYASFRKLAALSEEVGEEWPLLVGETMEAWRMQAEEACSAVPEGRRARARETFRLSLCELMAAAVSKAAGIEAPKIDLREQAMLLAWAQKPFADWDKGIVGLAEAAGPDDLGILAVCRGLLADAVNERIGQDAPLQDGAAGDGESRW